MRYIYGPVKSRRLGNSLGISVVDYKVCSYDCVYCQLKATTTKTLRRKKYIQPKDIIGEVREFLVSHQKHPVPKRRLSWPVSQESLMEHIDFITFSGSGEPTLNSCIGYLIKEVKRLTSIPVVLITNSSTLMKRQVRKEILKADIIIPSLDAVTQDIFEKIDRPAKGIHVQDIINALVQLRKEYKGEIWLEIMLVKGLNDSFPYILQMKEVVQLIRPDKIHINSPVRPPAEGWVKPVSSAALKKIKQVFGSLCEVV
ncbi:MAG: radical SAM protein [Candidatus Omnitrophota bacterium]